MLIIPLVAGGGAVIDTAVAAERARTKEGLNLREKPAESAEVLVVIPKGITIAVTGDEKDSYLPVTYDGIDGWAAAEYLELLEAPTPMPEQEPTGEAEVVESLNLREGPGEDYYALMVIPAGETVETFDEISGRYQLVRFDGTVGWVRTVYLDLPLGAAPVDEGDLPPGTGGAPGGPVTVAEGATATLAAEVVLRSDPSPEGEKVGVVPLGSAVTLIGPRTNGYAEVEFEKEKGWVAEGYLNLDLEYRAEVASEVPVLLYHSIQESPGTYQVVAEQLEEQLWWLSANGYTSITSADLLAWITSGAPLPEKPVMITIDDGYATDWFFLELLEKYHMKGVFFLPNYADMTGEQLRTLARAGEVCGHTVSHPLLENLDYNGQWEEIYGNKTMLEEVLGVPISCFAYPFGSYNQITDYVVIDSGYQIAYNAWGGPAQLNGSLDRWHITRINIDGSYSLDDFIAVVNGG